MPQCEQCGADLKTPIQLRQHRASQECRPMAEPVPQPPTTATALKEPVPQPPATAAASREQKQLEKLREANAKYKNLLKLAKGRIQEQEGVLDERRGE